MKSDEILSVYDDWYADTYEGRFNTGAPWTDNLTAYKVEVIRELLPDGGRWLDVACGLGVHLSRFPGVERCGLDLSPSMLASARERNPDADFVQGSYLDPRPEWERRWSLVTNLWIGYQYVESMRHVEDFVDNISGWVADDGSLMIHVIDCEDVARGIDPPWEDPETPVFADSLYITGVLWSWREANGRVHRDLVAPQLQRMVNLVARHFEDVEVRRWPAIGVGEHRPKAVIGHKRRTTSLTAEEVGDTHPFRLTFPPRDHPMEHGYDDEEQRRLDEHEARARAAEEERRAAEQARRAAEELRRGAAEWAQAEEELRARLAAGDAALAREAEAASHPPHVCPPPTSAAPLPTGILARELVRRLSPTDGRAWRSAARSARRRLPGRR